MSFSVIYNKVRKKLFKDEGFEWSDTLYAYTDDGVQKFVDGEWVDVTENEAPKFRERR